MRCLLRDWPGWSSQHRVSGGAGLDQLNRPGDVALDLRPARPGEPGPQPDPGRPDARGEQERRARLECPDVGRVENGLLAQGDVLRDAARLAQAEGPHWYVVGAYQVGYFPA